MYSKSFSLAAYRLSCAAHSEEIEQFAPPTTPVTMAVVRSSAL
jgi:hypothetical protein